MRFDRDEHGDWFVDPGDLARRLGLTSGDLQRQMRLGLVTSRFERGSEEDEGRLRVTVRVGSTAWQGTFNEAGQLISESLLP